MELQSQDFSKVSFHRCLDLFVRKFFHLILSTVQSHSWNHFHKTKKKIQSSQGPRLKNTTGRWSNYRIISNKIFGLYLCTTRPNPLNFHFITCKNLNKRLQFIYYSLQNYLLYFLLVNKILIIFSVFSSISMHIDGSSNQVH